jgi:hypothetical protein
MIKGIFSNCSKKINNKIIRGTACKTVFPKQSVLSITVKTNETILSLQKRWTTTKTPKTINKKLNIPKLSNELRKELEQESASDNVDVEFEDLRKEVLKTFTLNEEVGFGVVKLHRVYNDETIDVKFDCQDESENDLGDYPPDDDGNDEEVPSVSYGIQCRIIISKGIFCFVFL